MNFFLGLLFIAIFIFQLHFYRWELHSVSWITFQKGVIILFFLLKLHLDLFFQLMFFDITAIRLLLLVIKSSKVAFWFFRLIFFCGWLILPRSSSISNFLCDLSCFSSSLCQILWIYFSSYFSAFSSFSSILSTLSIAWKYFASWRLMCDKSFCCFFFNLLSINFLYFFFSWIRRKYI